MAVPLTFRGRLPGVLVETALPQRRDTALRLDVAGFVGFAERGPINTPVAVEDYTGFQHVFGDDLPIILDDGAPVFAYLASAVRAFFDNGGRRCYVVRVVGNNARPNRLPLPGLVTVDAAGGFRQVVAPAAWAGRWSDGMSVGTQLRAFPLRIAAGDSYSFDSDAGTARLRLEVPSPTTVREGDMVRLGFADAPPMQLILRVRSVAVTGVFSVRGFPITLELDSVAGRVAFSSGVPIPTPAPAAVERLDEMGWQPLVGALHPVVVKTGDDPGHHLFLSQHAPVSVGDLLRLRYEAGELFYFPVAAQRLHYAPPFADDVLLPDDDPDLPEGVYRRVVTDAPLSHHLIDQVVGTPTLVERLRFDITNEEGTRTLEFLQDLSFNPTAAYRAAQASDIPTEQTVSDYWVDRLAAVGDDAPAVELAAFNHRSRFLRGPQGATAPGAVWLPLAMRPLPTFAAPLPDGNPAGKDGLDEFDPATMFLDPQLADATVEGLMPSAEAILYGRHPAGRLIKLHSLTAIEEIGLIAVPDLVHCAWFPRPAPPIPPTVEPPTPPEPAWADFVDCPRPEDVPPPPYDPEKANCLDSAIRPTAGRWTPLERDLCLEFAGLPVSQPREMYDVDALLRVQRALVTLCAARADVLSVLSLPMHFGRHETADWQLRLVSTPAFLSSSVLSYGAVFHGWTLTRETTCPALSPVRAVPPEGALCGLIAAREWIDGVWSPAANAPLVGVLGLTPNLNDADWEELYNRQINVLRQQPGRFTVMSAFTLSADRLLLSYSVRRLLIFLRKLALRRGQRFVFETNNERFRQQVQLSFVRLLSSLVERGALAAFQVVTNNEVNTPNDEFNGRFVVALKVAPTLPVEFITVVMLRSGESLLEVRER